MTLKRKIHRVLPRFTQGSTSEANRIHDKNKNIIKEIVKANSKIEQMELKKKKKEKKNTRSMTSNLRKLTKGFY